LNGASVMNFAIQKMRISSFIMKAFGGKLLPTYGLAGVIG